MVELGHIVVTGVSEAYRMHQRPQGPDEQIAEAAAVSGQLDRMLASRDLDASPRCRALLRFIVEETVAGRREALTEAAIATRVFERREDHDPALDPIVRIQAGRLRRSLDRYYRRSGARDPVRIALPRGTYVPLLHQGLPIQEYCQATEAIR